MSWEILHQVDDDLGIQEVEDLAVDELLASKIGHAYFESSADNAKLQKIMKENQHPTLPYPSTLAILWQSYGPQN